MNLFDSEFIISTSEATGLEPVCQVSGQYWRFVWRARNGEVWSLFPGEFHWSKKNGKGHVHYYYDSSGTTLRRIVRILGGTQTSEYFDSSGKRITFQEYLHGK